MTINPKTAAILSYIWWPGLLLAFILNNKNYSSLTSFHIRQSIGLSLISFAAGLSAHFGIPLLSTILFWSYFAGTIFGILSAIKGETKPVPFLGDMFQDWFKSI
ncbi:MAG: hypothetical protein KAH07_02735 [Flavobacteriaceae bacterium]|nr:hypothetical protein [Flavobacteriaceae bacterium]